MRSGFPFTPTLRLARGLVLALAMALAASPAFALRIVLTNDDGFETRNIQALFHALKAAGHDVILSAPYHDQSGTSALLGSLSNLSVTARTSSGGRLSAGSPGAGPTGIAPDQYYVDSSPVAAVLYGIDVPARAKWGARPDLVIAGPNVGNNLGGITPHSGTIGAAITALNRSIPAIAVSAANDDAASTTLLSALVLRLLTTIEVQGKVTLPPGIGLNVNVPPLDPARAVASYHFAFTRVAFGSDSGLRFTADGEHQPLAAGPPEETAALVDTSFRSETSAFGGGGTTITVSPIQGTYAAPPDQAALVLTRLRSLFAAPPAVANPKWTNLSVRGHVGTGDAVQVLGFVIAESTPKTVLIRASGASLAAFGVASPLEDPAVDVFDHQNRLIATNDNWSSEPAAAAAITGAAAKVGAFAWTPGSKDAALLVTLSPGNHTIVVRGVGNTTGIALIEAYDVSVD